MTTGKEYLTTVISRLKYYRELAEKTFDQLEERDFHFQPSSESNSIAVMVQHMAGNMLSRFTGFLTEDGEKEWRERDAEFEDQEYAKEKIIETWDRGWKCVLDVLDSLKEEDLTKTVYIRKEPLSAMDAINRQLAHYSYHIGQIVYLGRLIRNENWKSLSIPKGKSAAFNKTKGPKDPAKKYHKH